MENKKLYLGAWNFNKSILADKMDKYVVENGGELRGYYRNGIIYRRDPKTYECYCETETNHCDTFGSSISFILNGEYVYVDINDNPFFDMYIQKIKLDENGKYVGSYYSEKIEKHWLIDALFSHKITDEEMEYAFELLKDEIIKAPVSKRVIEKKRQRVSNRYDGRYHYEYIDVSDRKMHEPTERKELCY